MGPEKKKNYVKQKHFPKRKALLCVCDIYS